MPDGSGLVIAIVAVVVVIILLAAGINGYLGKKASAKEVEAFKKDLLGYMKEKQAHKDAADAASAAIKPVEPFTPAAVDDFLTRTEAPWPPKAS